MVLTHAREEEELEAELAIFDRFDIDDIGALSAMQIGGVLAEVLGQDETDEEYLESVMEAFDEVCCCRSATLFDACTNLKHHATGPRWHDRHRGTLLCNSTVIPKPCALGLTFIRAMP